MKTNHKLKITTCNDKVTRAECSCGGWGFMDGGRVPISKVQGIHELHKMGALTGEPDREAFMKKMCAPIKVTDRSRDKFLAELLEIAREARKLHMMIECLDLGPKFRKQIMKRSTKICEWLMAIGDRVPNGGNLEPCTRCGLMCQPGGEKTEPLTQDTAALVDACWQLVRTIDSTGGLVPAIDSPMGMKAPAEDPEWIDLGEAYLAAKKALKSTKKNNGAAAIVGPDIDNDESIPGTEAVDVLTDVVHRARKVLK